MSAREFVDKVADEVADPEAKATIENLVADGYDVVHFVVYVAAGKLGDSASSLVREKGPLAEDRLKSVLLLAESAVRNGISQVSDSVGTDFLPAIVSRGPIPRALLAQMGPELQRLVTFGGFPVEPGADDRSQ
jgi:hypothetical protein